MNKEIKEILDRLKDSVTNPIDTEVDQFTQEAYDVPNYFCLDPTTNDCKVLSDYITNLQTIEQQYSALLSENVELENKITNLQQENERLNENKRHTLNSINRTIEIIKQQPTEDDSWILDRLDGFKYVLTGGDKE